MNSRIGQDDAGTTWSFDFAALMEHSDGNLPQDRRHNLKICGVCETGMGLQLGGDLTYRTGRSTNSLRVHPMDPFAHLCSAFSFYTDGRPHPPSERRRHH